MPDLAERVEAAEGVNRPAGVFVQIWANWFWLPKLSNTALGIVISWGPLLVGYVRDSKTAAALKARNQ